MRAVLASLRHPSPLVRTAAVETIVALRLRGFDKPMEEFLSDPHSELRAAAVAYLLALGADPVKIARTLLDGADTALRDHALEVLSVAPGPAAPAVTVEWVDARIESGTPDDLVIAACALAALSGRPVVERLRLLLRQPNPDVQRAALHTAARRPSRALLPAIVPLLLAPELSLDARRALAAIGAPAVPADCSTADKATMRRPRRPTCSRGSETPQRPTPSSLSREPSIPRNATSPS